MRPSSSRSVVRDERGLSTVEYTVLLVLIVACAVGLWNKFGQRVTDRLSQSSDKFDQQVQVTEP